MNRIACLDDLDWIIALDQDILKSGWTRFDYEQCLSTILVDDLCRGFICYRANEDHAEVLQIAIQASCQKTGLGSLLYLDFEQKVKVKTIFLEVSETNIGACSFYNKLGFIVNRIRKNYYGPGCSGIEMRKDVEL